MNNITSRKAVEHLINVALEKKAETVNGYLIYLFIFKRKGEEKEKPMGVQCV